MWEWHDLCSKSTLTAMWKTDCREIRLEHWPASPFLGLYISVVKAGEQKGNGDLA